MKIKQALTYDDIQLIPAYSDIESRSRINLQTRFTRNFDIMVPFVASPMDTVCGEEMAKRMYELGGVGIVHRFMSIEEQGDIIKRLQKFVYGKKFDDLYELWEENSKPIVGCIGANGDYFERGEHLIEQGANVLLIDVAHGHHKFVKEAIRNIKSKYSVDIIAGNIATKAAASDLIKWGADGLRVGIGGGCFTPHMEVKTENGLKRIEDIEIGDMVYTHTGELKPVFNKFIYDDYDEIYDIDGIEATPNHKFYVVHQSKVDLIETDEDIHRYAEWKRADELNDEYYSVELD